MPKKVSKSRIELKAAKANFIQEPRPQGKRDLVQGRAQFQLQRGQVGFVTQEQDQGPWTERTTKQQQNEGEPG